MHRINLLPLVGCLVVLLTPMSAAAQDGRTDPGADARFHFGPVAVQPTIALTNVGRDTNVFNAATGQQGDFTATFIPGATSWLRLGLAQLMSRTTLECLYFQHTPAQRSAGLGEDVRVDFLLARMTPHAEAIYRRSSQRPNAEIDVRSQQTTESGLVGMSTTVASRTKVDFTVTRTQLTFADVAFLGVNLKEQLSRTSTIADVAVHVSLTPLTEFVLVTGVQRDRFPGAAERNSDSVTVLPGLEWNQYAILTGSASVGYRRFRALGANVRSFKGLIADVNTAYVISDLSRLSFSASRNIDYSVEVEQPYFLTTSTGLTLTQSLAGPWDAVVHYSRTWLNYQNLTTASNGTPAPHRIDRENVMGVGVGYRMANRARIGFDINRIRRLSPVAARQFKGFQFGGGFTYGG